MRDLPEAGTAPLLKPRPKARRRSARRPLLWLLLAAGAVAALMGGVRYGVAREATPHLATAGPLEMVVTGPGTLEGRRKAVLSTTAQGRLVELGVAEGDRVRAGAVVARFDDARSRIEVEKARDEVRVSAQMVAEAKAQLSREEAHLARDERELARRRALKERAVVSDGALDIAQADRNAAAARVAEAQARVRRLEAELAVAEHRIALAQEALDQTRIRAPFDGVVIGKSQEVGDVVTPGTAVLRVLDTGSLVLIARFDESVMALISEGQSAQVRFESEPGRPRAAEVVRINPEVDTETREVTVDLKLRSLPDSWAVGQRGTGEIRIGTKPEAVTVPSSVLVRRGEEVGVWVLDRGRARWRPIALGAAVGDRVEVSAGLDGGATVLDGTRLYEAMRVELQS